MWRFEDELRASAKSGAHPPLSACIFPGFCARRAHSGGVAEWFKATVLKTVVRETAPWVRIPPPPPCSSIPDNRRMAVVNRSEVSLRIKGDTLVPTEITALLGSMPTLSYSKGDMVRAGHSVREIQMKFGMWAISAQPAEPIDIEFQIADILKKLSSDLTVWRALEREFDMDMFCGIFMESCSEGVGISHYTLTMLADRRIRIDMDIYSVDHEDGL
jgi:Domain of unknown function (DUF4279)